MTKMNPVVHFEMPYENRERLVKFYTKVFGWQMQKLGKDMGDYVTAATIETDENRMIKILGAINGGFFPKKPDWPAKDKGRMSKFCETAFGWQTEQLGKGLADGDWRNDEKRHP